ncbi:MAG TPA: hypothetical protein VFE24_12115 [Pirellulales bacterium]|jgi:preprotein translocase subunit SecB|nr:hypothetical protein [Pirellulales bacterium]
MAPKKLPEPSVAGVPTPQQLAAKLRLLEIRTLQSRAAFLFHESPINIEQRIDVQTQVRNDSSQIVAMIRFVLSGELKDGPGEQDFGVEATFGLTYQVDDPRALNHAFAQQFAQQGALFQIWPYWREFVHSASIRAGLPPLNVPAITPLVLQSIQFVAASPVKAPAPEPKPKKNSGKRGGQKR